METGVLSYPDTLAQLTAFNKRRAGVEAGSAEKWLKRGVWLYFWLLILEGALRKWVLPGLAAPLLIVRDPVAIWLILYAYQHKRFKASFSVVVIWVLTTLSLITTLLLGHGNLFVAIYGARIFLIHFPLIYLIGSLFTYDDVLDMGKTILWVSIPMTVLMAFQFYSPQSAWVNRGIGGDIAGGGFFGAKGFFRPPGTFSFINGLSAFYGLISAFIMYYWISGKKQISRVLLVVATACLLAAIPFSVSRTLLFSVGVSFLFALIASLKKPKYLSRMIATAAGGVILIYILSKLGVFSTSVDVMSTRLEQANGIEGGVEGTFVNRVLGGLTSAISGSANFPFWGLGLGMGTNAGAQLLSGKVGFLVAEGEWGRIIGEMGILLGLIVVLIRVHLTWQLGFYSYKNVGNNNFLPWMLYSFCALLVFQGQWAQPTALGFSVLSAGLTLAAFRKNRMGSTRIDKKTNT